MIFRVFGWRHRPSAGPGCLALGSGLTVPLAATHMGDSGLRGVFRAIAQATGRGTRERKAASGIPGNGGHRHAGPGWGREDWRPVYPDVKGLPGLMRQT